MSGDKNGQSKEDIGKPSGTGRGGSGLQDAIIRPSEREIVEKYLDENERPDENLNVRHKNRNTDKGREDQGSESTSV